MEKEKMRIIIDPGHGGDDPGAIGNGVKEKELNLAIALELKSRVLAGLSQPEILNPGSGFQITLTRDSDTFLSLKNRVEIANQFKEGIFLSIHCNASLDSRAQGIEVFYYPSSPEGEKLARSIYFFLCQLGREKRGTKPANFYVLKWTKVPAVLLECGFVSNAEEALWIKDNVPEIAFEIARGIKAYISSGKENRFLG